MSATVRDDTYYCPDLVIKIENVLFRVPRILFEQSETFSDMFEIPPLQGATVEGSDDDQPLVLEWHLVHEFWALLQVMFPPKHNAPDGLDLDHWIAVLKPATVWGFAAIRVTALEKLARWTGADPILKGILSQKYNIQDWLVPGVNAIARRDEPLSTKDMRRFEDLGDAAYVLGFALKIGRVRESFVGQYTPPQNFPLWGVCGKLQPPGERVGQAVLQLSPVRVPRGQHAVRSNERGAQGRVTHDFTTVICEVFRCRPNNSQTDTSVFAYGV